MTAIDLKQKAEEWADKNRGADGNSARTERIEGYIAGCESQAAEIERLKRLAYERLTNFAVMQDENAKLRAEIEAIKKGTSRPPGSPTDQSSRWSDLNAQLTMKIDDWIDACKEIDQLRAEIERLRKEVGSKAAWATQMQKDLQASRAELDACRNTVDLAEKGRKVALQAMHASQSREEERTEEVIKLRTKLEACRSHRDKAVTDCHNLNQLYITEKDDARRDLQSSRDQVEHLKGQLKFTEDARLWLAKALDHTTKELSGLRIAAEYLVRSTRNDSAPFPAGFNELEEALFPDGRASGKG